MRTAALVSLYLAAAALGTYLTFRPTFDSRFERVQTERGDGVLNHYILEHSWLAVSDPSYRGSLFTAPFYYPAKWNVFYSENLFGVAPLYWALRLALPYDLAYPWWQILLNLLNFVSFALVGRRMKWPHLITLGGAFMWAFALVHADQIKHQQMIGRFWMPVAAYYAVVLVTEPTAKALNRLLGGVFLQCLACIYTGWFLVAGLCVFLPVMIALRPGAFAALTQLARDDRARVKRIVAVWGVAMLALFGPYLTVNWGIARFYEETHGLMPTPSAWFTGPPDSKWTITTARFRAPVSLECWLFSGFTIYALMLAAGVWVFARARDERPPEWPLVAAALVTVLVWAVVTLAPREKGDSLWRLVRYVPGGMGIRAVARVYLVVYLFGSFAALAWLARVTSGVGRTPLRLAVQAAVVGFMMFEQTEYQQPNFARKDFYPLVDATADRLRGAEVGWVVPRYTDSAGDTFGVPYADVFAMWAGLRANVPVVNGYSGRSPKGFPPFGATTDEQVRAWLTGKYRGPVRVVDPNAPERTREVMVE